MSCSELLIDFQAPADLDWTMRNSSRRRLIACLIVQISVLATMLCACSSDSSVPPDVGVSRPDIFVEAELTDSHPTISDISDISTPTDIMAPSDVATETDTITDANDVEWDDNDIIEDGVLHSGPTLYPPGRLLSPVTENVAENLRAIAFTGLELKSDVFMKVGASSTVSNANLHCFAGNQIQLDEYEDLQPAIDFFLAGDAAGGNPFERETLAAKVGMSAGWVMTGSPSPLDLEIEAIQPGYAFVHYGTNDMGLGSTYESALWKFGDRMLELSDELIAEGIIPVLMTIAARGDKISANRWVPTYNAVIRAVAQSRQIPLLDLHYALEPLEDDGLSGDGIHLNTYKADGFYRPCVFTPAGLAFGMNMRNLVSLMALDTLRWIVALQENVVEEGVFLEGDSSVEAPFLIKNLPFSDSRNTTNGGSSIFDKYVGCQADQDESGNEYVYSITLDEERHVRALVIDQGDTDIDIHLLNASALEAGCLARDHQIIEATLKPGTYTFVLDTFVSNGIPKTGEYLFVLLECDPDDSACKSLLLEDTP